MYRPQAEEDRQPAEVANPGAALWPLLRAIRSHPRVVAAIVAATFGASLLWLVQRSPEYSASAEILVAPLSASDRSFVGLPLIRAVGPDASTGVGSAVSIVDTRDAAKLLARRLGDGTTPEAIDTAVTVERSEESSTVSVTARAASPERAVEIANGFVRAALDQRKNDLRELTESQLDRSRELMREARSGGSSFVAVEALRARIADLRQVSESGDPTLAPAREAVLPNAPDGSPAILVLSVSLVAGIGLGLATAVLIEVLGPARISSEDALLEAYALPILARLPAISASAAPTAAGLTALREAHRALRSQLEFHVPGLPRSGDGTGDRSRVIAIAGVSRGEETALVASNLGYAIARAGDSCSIVDLDRSAAGVGSLLGATGTQHGLARLPGSESGSFARVPVGSGESLEVVSLVAEDYETEHSASDLRTLIELARGWSTWVVADVSGLGVSAEFLPVLRAVDGVVLIVSLGQTSTSELARAREALELARLTPVGYVVLGRGEAGFLASGRSRISAWARRPRT